MAKRKALKGFETLAPIGRVAAGEEFDDTTLSEEDEAWLIKKGCLAKLSAPRRTLFKKKVTSG